MADFVAVIRRAVDGLADNTPEMRVKVYERARGAVRRQLESMKPRPPEEMLRRQLDKLEAAIIDVEAEHAEALPLAEEPVAAAPVIHEEPPPAPPEEHYAAEEPAVEEPKYVPPAPVYEEPPRAEVYAREEPAPSYVPVHEEPAYEEPQPVHHPEPEPVEEWVEAPQVHQAEAYVEPVAEVVKEEPRRVVEPAPAIVAAPAYAAPQVVPVVHAQDDVINQVDEIWAEVAAPAKRAEPVEPVMPAAAFVPAPFGHPVETPPIVAPRAPAVDKGFAWDADVFEELQPVSAPSVKQAQPVRQMSDNAFDDVDLFAEVHSPKAVPKSDPTNDGWRELKELAGFDKYVDEGRSNGNGNAIPPDLDQSMSAKLQGRSYRMEPKPRRRISVTGVVLTLVGLAIVAGGGYAAWLNREALNKMVTDLISSAPKTAANTAPQTANNAVTPAATKPATSTPATNTPAATTPAATTPATPKTQTAATSPATNPTQGGNAPAQVPAAANTNVASLDNDPNTVNTKFTQRLLTNGSEVDDGPAAVGGQPGVAEGKSVAEQNIASAAAPPAVTTPPPVVNTNASQAQNAAANTPAPTPQTAIQQAPADQQQQTPPPTDQQASAAQQPPPAAQQQSSDDQQQTAPVTDGQKVFLYEERLGQTSPTAFQGAVTWSLQEGKGEDGRPEPSVQGLITVPERGLTATITLSRNTDTSLPASHLVELAFQVPPNFEGGAIDSVQRIALKATEQDRGDALIGVPAKVTDDVYMIALNDFPDARKTNMDLLKNRNWIDIPVVYRNGRRALLTMEKGQAGTDAFNKAIGEWSALGGVASTGQ